MRKNVKRNIVLSVITICLLLVLLTGSTYALFSDKIEVVDMVVGTAKVDIDASIELTETNSLISGTATLKNNVIELVNVAPGDEVAFTVNIKNTSTIKIIQRVLVTETTNNSELYDALEIKLYTKVNNQLESLTDGAWSDVAAKTNTQIVVFVKLPETVGNDYQEASCSLKVIVEAYQANYKDNATA